MGVRVKSGDADVMCALWCIGDELEPMHRAFAKRPIIGMAWPVVKPWRGTYARTAASCVVLARTAAENHGRPDIAVKRSSWRAGFGGPAATQRALMFMSLMKIGWRRIQ